MRLQKEYIDYLDSVMEQIHASTETRKRIRQSLTEHIEAMIDQYGSLAYKHLSPAEEVAKEFMENISEDEKPTTYSVTPPWWINRSYYRRNISEKKIFNIPLYHFTDGYNPETGEFEVAKGIFAVGPVAIGVFAIGGIGLGVFTIGGMGIGLLIAMGGMALSLGAALGGLAIGGLLAIGGGAFSGGLAMGGLAYGRIAIGGRVVGEYIYNSTTGEGNAVEWFQRNMPYFVKYFN